MRATWRPMAAWPYPPVPRRPKSFAVSWGKTLDELEHEIALLKGEDLVIGVVANDDQFRIDGTPRAGFKVEYRGAEVSFSVDQTRTVFHTDAFNSLQENLRAISLGMTALRAIDRYGITTSGEQYAGFAQLAAGESKFDRGRRLVEEAGSLKAALFRNHPDQGGTEEDLDAVIAYRDGSKAVART